MSLRGTASAGREDGVGLFYGVLAYSAWGLGPLYWRQLAHVAPVTVLAHRMLWAALLFLFLVVVRRRLGPLREALRPGLLRPLIASGLLISTNWLVFIFAVTNGHIVEASLGYFVNPLLSVALGTLVLGERLLPSQWLAVALALVGVTVLTVASGRIPWIGLALALTFALYGLIRKVAAVDALPGSTLELLLLCPFGLIYALTHSPSGRTGPLDLWTVSFLIGAGAMTALPLLWFTLAARRLRLATVGFLQYLAPTGQFLIGVFVYHEEVSGAELRGFILVWCALAVFSWAMLRTQRSPPQARAEIATTFPGATGYADQIAAELSPDDAATSTVTPRS
jgi:chloramphenicol-sensitive protein RarD